MKPGLGVGRKAGYGTAELGLSAVELLLQVYLLELYIRAGLDPFLAGLALAVAVFWDAASDPLMGVVSDRTRAGSKAGMRLPYFFAGTVALGIAIYWLFSPNQGLGQGPLFGYLLTWYLILNTAMTLVAVPHLAMANDLSSEKAERTELFGWRLGCGAIGLLVGLLVPVWVASQSAVEGKGALLDQRSESSLWIGILAVVTCTVSGLAVWGPLKGKGRRENVEGEKGRVWDFLKLGWGSGAMKAVLLSFVFISIGRAFNSSLALVFYKGTLSFSEQQVGIVLIVLAFSILLAAPLWIGLAKRISKARLSVFALGGLTLLTALAYPLLPVGVVWPVLIVAFVGGVMVARIALLESMFSDSVETLERSESKALSGACYGLWRMSTKVARGLGLLCSGWFLSAVGYREGALEQTTFVDRSVAWAFGPGVAIFFGLGWWMLWRNRAARDE